MNISWQEAQRICDLPVVDETIRTFSHDSTNDNAVGMVQSIIDTYWSKHDHPECTPLPWRITEPNEKKTREIVGANGSTVARLTVLDMANAELIVAAVNAFHKGTQ